MKTIGNWIIMHKSEQETREALSIFGIADWIKGQRGENAPDEFMKAIVRRVYDGKRTVHKNPIRTKVQA
jgi:hypothetical protein